MFESDKNGIRMVVFVTLFPTNFIEVHHCNWKGVNFCWIFVGGSFFSWDLIKAAFPELSVRRSRRYRLEYQPLFVKGARAPPPNSPSAPGATWTRLERAAKIEPTGDSIQKKSHLSHYYLFDTFTHEVKITTDCTDQKVHFSNGSYITYVTDINILSRFVY